MWKTLSHSALALFYPQECCICRGEVSCPEGGTVCSSCWEATKTFDGSETLCTKCGAFLFEGGLPEPTFCRKCDEQQYDLAAAAGIYERALSASVLRLKREPFVSKRLKMHLAATFERMAVDDAAIVVPVPLSPRRLSERGFNQASVLGKIVAKQFGLPFDECTLVRSVHTPMHRAGMDRKARAMTVKNAFEVVRPRLIAGMPILLIDDVLTSGETASICSSVLKKSGAASVSVLTIARAA